MISGARIELLLLAPIPCMPPSVVSGRLFFLGRPANLNFRGSAGRAVTSYRMCVRCIGSRLHPSVVCNSATKRCFFLFLLPLCRDARGDCFLVESVRHPPSCRVCAHLPVFFSLAAVLRCLFFSCFCLLKMGVPFSFFIAFAIANALRWSYIVRIRDTVLVCLFVYMPAGFVNGWERGWLERLVPPSVFFCVAPPRQQGRSSRRSNGVLLRLYLFCLHVGALQGYLYIQYILLWGSACGWRWLA